MPAVVEKRKRMAKEPVLDRLGPDDQPERVGSILAGLFAEADRRVAMAEADVEAVRS